MGPASHRKESPKKEAPKQLLKDGLKLDIAQLTEAGYIEVQGGKMRLVIDMLETYSYRPPKCGASCSRNVSF
jgi:hypothetical protein